MRETRTPQGRVLQLVILHRDPATRLLLLQAGGSPLDLNLDAPIDELAADLRNSVVTLAEDELEDVPSTVFEALWVMAVPPMFAGSPWLHRARPLVLEDNQTTVAGVRIGYVAGCGLWVQPADRCDTPQ